MLWGGNTASPLPATFVSATELELTLPPSPGTCGEVPVTVRTPEGEIAASQAMFRYKYGSLNFTSSSTTPLAMYGRSVTAARVDPDAALDLLITYRGGLPIGFAKGDANWASQRPRVSGSSTPTMPTSRSRT